jgi:hypothetical protein
MPPASNWRSLTQHDYLKDLDRPGFAWEFLRRNPAYQEDYNTIAQEDASDAAGEGSRREPLVSRWGLTFPDRPAACCRSSDRLLAARGAA